MREIFKYGSVGRALRKRCLYPEADGVKIAVIRKGGAKFGVCWLCATVYGRNYEYRFRFHF